MLLMLHRMVVHLRIVPPSLPSSLPAFFRGSSMEVRRKGGREGGREGGRVGGRVLIVHHVGGNLGRSRSRAIRSIGRRKLRGERRRGGLTEGEERHGEGERANLGLTRESERGSVAGLLIHNLSLVLLLVRMQLLLFVAFLPSQRRVRERERGRG